jgi:hypothetical protein
VSDVTVESLYGRKMLCVPSQKYQHMFHGLTICVVTPESHCYVTRTVHQNDFGYLSLKS